MCIKSWNQPRNEPIFHWKSYFSLKTINCSIAQLGTTLRAKAFLVLNSWEHLFYMFVCNPFWVETSLLPFSTSAIFVCKKWHNQFFLPPYWFRRIVSRWLWLEKSRSRHFLRGKITLVKKGYWKEMPGAELGMPLQHSFKWKIF